MIQVETQAVQRQGLPNKQQAEELLQPLADGLVQIGNKMLAIGKDRQASRSSKRKREDQKKQPVTSAVTQHVAIRQVLRGEHQSETDRPPDPKQIFREQVKKERRKIEEKLSQEVRKRSQMMADLAYYNGGVAVTRDGELVANLLEDENELSGKAAFSHEVEEKYNTALGIAKETLSLRKSLITAAKAGELTDLSESRGEQPIYDQERLIDLALPDPKHTLERLAKKQARVERAQKQISGQEQPDNTLRARLKAYEQTLRQLGTTLSPEGRNTYHQILNEQRQLALEAAEQDVTEWTSQTLAEELRADAKFLTKNFLGTASTANTMRVLGRVEEPDEDGRGKIDLIKMREQIQEKLRTLRETTVPNNEARKTEEEKVSSEIVSMISLVPVKLNERFESSSCGYNSLLAILESDKTRCHGFAEMLRLVNQSLGMDTGFVMHTTGKLRKTSHTMLYVNLPGRGGAIINWGTTYEVEQSPLFFFGNLNTIDSRTGERKGWFSPASFPYYKTTLVAQRHDQDIPTSYADDMVELLNNAGVETGLQIIEELAEMLPYDVRIQTYYAKILLESENLPKAREILEHAVTTNPSHAYTHYLLGDVCLSQKDPVGARKHYELAVALDPENAPAYINLGNLLAQENDVDAAWMLFTHVIALDLDGFETFRKLADFEELEGNPAIAILLHRIAPELDLACGQFLFNLAMRFHEQKDLEKAKVLLANAITLQPEDAVIHTNLGVVFEQQEELDGAISCYRRAIELDPENATINYNLSRALSKQGEFAEAEKFIQAASKLDFESVQIFHAWGEILYHQGKYDEAREMYQRANELDPEDEATYSNLAILEEKLGNLKEAGKLHEQAAALDSDRPDIYFFFGDFLFRQNNWEKAKEMYQRAIELDPTNAFIYCRLALLEEKSGNLKEAGKLHETALELDPDFALKSLTEGTNLLLNGDLEEARTWLELSIKLNPELAKAYTNLGAVFLNQGNLEEARQMFKKAVEFDPDLAAAYNNMGMIAHMQEDLQRARKMHEQAVALDPENADFHYQLGNILYEQTDIEGAKEMYQRAVELDSDSAVFATDLGGVLIELGDLDRARTLLERAIQLDSPLAETYHNLGYILHKQGDLAKAGVMFTKALTINPDFVEAMKALEELASEE